MLDASSISLVLQVYRPERAHLLKLLGGLSHEQWELPTECPAYDVKGIAIHILGDDLSLLSRQRDGAEQGLSLLIEEMPRADHRTLLDTFNDRWVAAARFLSPDLLMELLDLAGEWTAAYYEAVDPNSPGEPVRLFGATEGSSSPFWHAVAREYLERWIHHSQIRRAVGLPPLADEQFLIPGVEVVAAIAGSEWKSPKSLDGEWTIGPVSLGSAQQTADILTRGFSSAEVRRRARGPAGFVAIFAEVAGRP